MIRWLPTPLLALVALMTLTGAGPAPIDSLVGKCPEGQTYWDNHNECVQDGIITEVDGIPMEDLRKILDVHDTDLQAIKGVAGYGIDQHGIFIEIMPDHDPMPTALDSAPVHTHPYTSANTVMFHTDSTWIRPIAPGVLVSSWPPNNTGTLGMPVLAHGELWALTTAHQIIFHCGENPPYAPPGPGLLWTVPRYTGTQTYFRQPENQQNAVFGWPQTFSKLIPDTNPSTNPYRDIDAAANAIDNNNIAGDYSMATWDLAHYPLPATWEVRQDIEGSEGETVHSKVTELGAPSVGEAVFVYTGDALNTGTHIIAGSITAVDKTEYIASDCQSPPASFGHWSNHQFRMTVTTRALENGDSGSLVRGQLSWKFLGTANWRDLNSPTHGGGTEAPTLSSVLGFDNVYGQNSTQLRVGPLSPSSGYNQFGGSYCTTVPIKNIGTQVSSSTKLELLTPLIPGQSFAWSSPAGGGVGYAITGGQTVNFTACLYSSVARAPLNYVLRAYGVNALADVIRFEYNTFTAGWGATPKANLYVIQTNINASDDLIRLPLYTTIGGYFSYATNIGSVPYTGYIDVHADGLPIYNSVCEWSIPLGNCITTPTPTPWATTIQPGQQKAYVAFLAANAPVTIDPHYHRIYTTFHDGLSLGGTVLGTAGFSVEVAQ